MGTREKVIRRGKLPLKQPVCVPVYIPEKARQPVLNPVPTLAPQPIRG